MSPRLMVGDIIVVGPEQKTKPGNLVVAFVGGQGIIVRQYKQRGVNQSFESFELVAVNSNWANIIVGQPEIAKIIGVVCQSMYVYL